jgi:ABC-type lipoprotein export system ATPase subunit
MESLKAEAVSKTYKIKRRTIQVLADLSFEVQAGDFVLLTGESGSGKTTLLSLVGGLDLPTSGNIYYGVYNMRTLAAKELTTFRREKVGFIFQDYVLFNELTVLNNVSLALQIQQGSTAGVRERAEFWLKRVGLSHRLEHRPGELSGGEKQRVGVARALIKQPTLLLVDEPTSNLDMENKAIILDVINVYHQETQGIVMVASHDDAFFTLADRVFHLQDGTVQNGHIGHDKGAS